MGPEPADEIVVKGGLNDGDALGDYSALDGLDTLYDFDTHTTLLIHQTTTPH